MTAFQLTQFSPIAMIHRDIMRRNDLLGTSSLSMANNMMGQNQTTVLTAIAEILTTPRRFLDVFFRNSPVLADRERDILARFRCDLRAAHYAATRLAGPGPMEYCALFTSPDLAKPKSDIS